MLVSLFESVFPLSAFGAPVSDAGSGPLQGSPDLSRAAEDGPGQDRPNEFVQHRCSDDEADEEVRELPESGVRAEKQGQPDNDPSLGYQREADIPSHV